MEQIPWYYISDISQQRLTQHISIVFALRDDIKYSVVEEI